MKVGDLVRNVVPMRTNPVVHSPEEEIPNGTIGVITKIRGTLVGGTSVDTVMRTAMGLAYCGGYDQGFFEVINESR